MLLRIEKLEERIPPILVCFCLQGKKVRVKCKCVLLYLLPS